MSIWTYLKTYHPRSYDRKENKRIKNAKAWKRKRIRRPVIIDEKYQIINLPHLECINELKRLAELRQDNPIPYKTRRTNFDKKKWKHFKHWKQCGACKKNKVEHIHHMIQLQYGGGNENSNLIGLCEKCHCEIHDWMIPKNFKDPITDEFNAILSN